MPIYKTTIIATVMALYPFLSSTGQVASKSQILNAIPLTNDDFEQICTLSSTGTDVFYYLHSRQLRSKEGLGVKTADIQVEYFTETDGPDWPEEAIDAFEYATEIWEVHLESDIPIRISAYWMDLGGGTLGSAGPTRIVKIDEGMPETWYSIAQGSAISGIDFVSGSQGTANETNYDVVVNMNSEWDSWYFGTDAQTPQSFIDFVTVVLHEIGHGIGFIGSMRVPEDNQVAEWGFDSPPDPLIFDRFVIDGNGNEILNENIYGNPSSALYDAVTGARGGIHFSGIATIGANHGEPVPLHAPSEWRAGSSYSHVDPETFANTENALMRPQIDRAFAIHTPGPAVCSILADKGWPLGNSCELLLGSKSQIMVDQETIDFGVTNVGSVVERELKITNEADAPDPLVGRVGVSGQTLFSIDNQDQILFLEPGESVDLKILYDPTRSGVTIGEIEINHNSANRENPYTIALSGEALAENKLFKLDQNYPNPFNAITNITYAITQTSYVKLEIYDGLGKHIQTLVDQEQATGRYTKQFHADELSSGVYMYRIIVDGKSKTGKLLLTK